MMLIFEVKSNKTVGKPLGHLEIIPNFTHISFKKLMLVYAKTRKDKGNRGMVQLSYSTEIVCMRNKIT